MPLNYKGLRKYIRYILENHEDYGHQLKQKGFEHPSHEKAGTYYTDIHGNPATANPNEPYGLFIYTPHKSESHFKTRQEAEQAAPKEGDWQVVNTITGFVYLDALEQKTSGGSSKL